MLLYLSHPGRRNAQLSASGIVDGESVRDLDDSPRCWRGCLRRGGDTPPRGRDNVLLDSMHPTRDTSVGRQQVSTAGARGHPRNATDDPRAAR